MTSWRLLLAEIKAGLEGGPLNLMAPSTAQLSCVSNCSGFIGLGK